jgi:dihydroorotase
VITTYTLTGCRVIDPANHVDGYANVVIEGERIAEVGRSGAGLRIDAEGLVVAPGLVDLHCHLREPGREDAETVATGTAAAAAGGFTAVCPMPNTDPVCDHAGVVEQVRRLAEHAGHCDVYPVGAITRGLAGKELAELGAMTAIGVRCFSDDGLPVRSAQMMRCALRYARTWDAIICNHAEEASLTEGAQMNEGVLSSALGLVGWPHEAEEIQVVRDLILAHGLGSRLHVPHVSTRGTVELIRAAKARGSRVTAEACPHHFTLCEAEVASFDPVFKVNPPLRTARDVEAIRAGLADGTIDAIATDHAPHSPETKEREWAYASCGMLGLETALALTLTELVKPGVLTLTQAIACLSTKPAASRDITEHGGPIQPGALANLVVFDPSASWTVDPERLSSRSRNTPYAGRELLGKVVYTILRGRFTCKQGQVV